MARNLSDFLETSMYNIPYYSQVLSIFTANLQTIQNSYVRVSHVELRN